MDSDRQISTTVMWAWIAWAGAVGLTLLATIIGVGWADAARERMVAVAIFAHAVLVLIAAACLTIKVMLRHQSGHLLGVLATHGDAERRVRQVSSLTP